MILFAYNISIHYMLFSLFICALLCFAQRLRFALPIVNHILHSLYALWFVYMCFASLRTKASLCSGYSKPCLAFMIVFEYALFISIH